MDDPIPQFTHFVTALKEEFPGLAYIHIIEPGVAGDQYYDVQFQQRHAANDFLRDIWAPNAYITAGGYNREDAISQADNRENELVAFGRVFIANVSLPPMYPFNVSFSLINY